VDLVVGLAVADILKALVVVPSPVEGCVAVWNKLAEHVVGRMCALVKSVAPVLNPGVPASLPIWEGADVASSKDVLL